MHYKYVNLNRPLEGTITTLDELEKELFLDFVFQMLEWAPERRASAKELLEHPWLEF